LGIRIPKTNGQGIAGELSMHRWLRAVSSAILAVLFSLHLSVALAGAEIKSHFDLPAESLDKALRDFAIQANCNISYDPSVVAGLQAPAIRGEFTPANVLVMMLTGTRLVAVSIGEDTIKVVEKSVFTSRDGVAPAMETDAVRRAHAGLDTRSPAAEQRVSGPPEPTPGAKSDNDKQLDQITVTGTHIRGTKDSPSPVQVFTRDDIDATGTNTIQQFLQTLPQNFGGASDNTIGEIAANTQTNNTVNGSAPNLRGLGAGATLVLINGHRVAPGNQDGSFVDVSLIPLAAVERIEIITDGASAIYGSDAVGGVVNIILRSKFDGAEIRAQYGSVTSGSMHDVQAAQTIGDEWVGGSAVLSYQYSDQTPLSAGSRDYLQSVLLPFDLLPEQVEQSAFTDLEEEIEPGFKLHADAMYSHRSTASVYGLDDGAFGSFHTVVPSVINTYSASLGSSVALPRQSALTIAATYSESDTTQETFQTPAAQPLEGVWKTKSATISLDLNIDGLLASIPAGEVHYAVGGQYRRESFGNTYLYPPTDNTFYPFRNVGAAYAELRIPVIGPRTTGGDTGLELTAADRGEHYSDFGSTNNPQLGAIWRPLSSLSVRGTYGTSFQAPLLSELDPIPVQIVAFPGASFNPGPGGNPNVLILNGGNPDLKPQKATAWTVGLDFKPQEHPGVTAKLTYYDIIFKNEINVASASINAVNIFVDEAILGPQIVQRNPPYSVIQQWISYPSFVNPLNVNPASIGAIFDDRSLNLSTAKTRGLDFSVGYKTTLGSSRIDTGIDGTYILTFDNQFSNSAPQTSILNTTYNPIDLRFRGRTVLTQGPISAGVYLNFTNDYTNNYVMPHERVASWTTADADLSYKFGLPDIPSSGILVAVSVINLANRNPPYAGNIFGYGITYDGVNANPLGRYLSLRLQKRF
jgi:iron complex outermembrane recepter protein